MGEVKYSINGKYFKDYRIYVSSSLGLLDALKRKPVKTYDWQEYHGESVDLSNPKFEAREIVLNCFIKGDNYQEMFDNFRNVVLSEFQKSGTQRLLVEPFGYKALPYEVYMIDEVKIAKEFSESTSIGVFSIKLIEPNPIKKVLYTTLNTLNLSYNSSKETEIFFVNGEKTTAKGNVSLSGKTLANRSVSGYNFNGRNLLKNSKNKPSGQGAGSSVQLSNGFKFISTGAYGFFEEIKNLELGQDYTISIKAKRNAGTNGNSILSYLNVDNSYLPLEGTENLTNEFKVYSLTRKLIGTNSNVEIYILFPSGEIEVEYIKLEKGTIPTDWQPAPEDERYIIIAGDIDGITNLTTNATVLWEKL